MLTNETVNTLAAINTIKYNLKSVTGCYILIEKISLCCFYVISKIHRGRTRVVLL